MKFFSIYSMNETMHTTTTLPWGNINKTESEFTHSYSYPYVRAITVTIYSIGSLIGSCFVPCQCLALRTKKSCLGGGGARRARGAARRGGGRGGGARGGGGRGGGV